MTQTVEHVVEVRSAHYFPEGVKILHAFEWDDVRWLIEWMRNHYTNFFYLLLARLDIFEKLFLLKILRKKFVYVC